MFDFAQASSPAAKAHLQSQCSMASDLSKQMFKAVQKVNELNNQVAQTVMEESISSTQQMLTSRDASEVLFVVAGQAQPIAGKVRAYQQRLADIAAGTQVDLAKTAESHIAQTTRTAQELAQEVTQKASEETQRISQRQEAAMEKLVTPINTRPDTGKSTSSSTH